MPSEAVILTSPEPDAFDLNLAKVVDFLGLKCRLLRIEDTHLSLDFLGRNIPDESPCLMVNATTLLEVLSNRNKVEGLKSYIRSRPCFVLIYNVLPTEEHSAALSNFTDGIVTGIVPFDHNGYTFDVVSDSRPICRQLSGLSVQSIDREHDFGFILENQAADSTTLIAIDKKPFFLRLPMAESSLFLVANNHIVDPDERSLFQIFLTLYISKLVPVLLFLKHVFGDKCWHRPVSQASAILDDPLLREPYGFLSYTKLLQVMDEHNFFMNIAFIPWNYKRTKPEVADLMASRPDRFALCVHGCDHTRREFSVRNPIELNRIIKRADARMAAHAESTGLGYDRFMLFPQAYFSRNAMMMLKLNGYLGAASVAINPRDRRERLPTASLLDLAVLDYYAFPLLLRRYPSQKLSFALDFLLGRPALIYLHPEDFREGFTGLIDLVHTINAFDEGIEWVSAANIIRSLYKQKRRDDGFTDIKLCADECVITNPAEAPQKYFITKEEKGDVVFEKMNLNGREAGCEIRNGVLSFSVEIPPRSRLEIKTFYKNDIPHIIRKNSLRKEVSVWVRRYLSELRDQHLSRNHYLVTRARRIMQKFR